MDFNVVDGKRPTFTQEQIEGRNMWMVWTGGNDRLWDRLTVDSLGSFDLLKTISSHPRTSSGYGRHNRLALSRAGERALLHGSERTGPEPVRLVARRSRPHLSARSVRRRDQYPGVKVGARGKTVPVGSYYGEPTGIVGLRLFPNPDFDERARKRWDSGSVLQRSELLLDRELVRPYRVGMSCGFCHMGPNPIKPPADAENPKWENLSSNVGAQYFWWDRIFDWRGAKNENSMFYQALHVSRPGTLDTSLVSTDNINNPRTMNAVYYLGPRMGLAKKWGKETLGGGGVEQQTVQRLRPAERSAVAVLRAAEHDVDAARAQGRIRLGWRARRAQPRLHQHRRVQRGVAAAFPRAARRRADLADSDRDGARRTRSTGARPKSRRRTWRGSSSPAPIRTTWRTRQAAKAI